MNSCIRNLVKYRILLSYLLVAHQGRAFQSIPAYCTSPKKGLQSRSFASFFNHNQIYTSSQLRLRYGEPYDRKYSLVVLNDSSNNFFSNKREEEVRDVVLETNDKKSNSNVMEDLVKYLRQDEENVMEKMISNDEEEESKEDSILLPIIGSVFIVTAAILSQNTAFVDAIQTFFADPTSALQEVVDNIKSMGDMGLVYFALTYTVAEVLAIPAIPLTASAGYLFGVQKGTLIVLLSGSVAAGIGFLIGRTLLREKVKEILKEYPKFQAIDRVIGKEGFKLMILLRLSPIFPFSLSNYLYGATSVKFWPYFFGTMLGFTPGTIAYVYTGTVGKALTLENGGAEPWYVYAGTLIAFVGILKVAADIANTAIEEMDVDDEFV